MKTTPSKAILLSLLMIFILTTGKSQNLIQNGDFEQYISCPVSFSQIDSTIGWTTPTALVSTDYFNTCALLSSFVGVPVNQGTGYQYPQSGNAYAGLFLLAFAPDSREYLETELTTPLTAGQCYNFEMYVNVLNGVKYTSDDIQVYFSDTLLDNIPSTGVLPFLPQIENTPGNYFDTLTWNHVQLNYTAIGGEKYITIGNFKTDANTSTVQIAPNALPAVYTYIDDVSLSICTGLKDAESNSTSIGPNPFIEEFSVTVSNNLISTIELFDVTARKVVSQDFKNTLTLKLQQLPAGNYFYRLYNKNSVFSTGKILKQ